MSLQQVEHRQLRRSLDRGDFPAIGDLSERASYIDPRVFDHYRDGTTIRGALGDIADGGEVTAIQGPAELAVLDLLE